MTKYFGTGTVTAGGTYSNQPSAIKWIVGYCVEDRGGGKGEINVASPIRVANILF